MSGRHRWDGPLHAVPREIRRVTVRASAAGAVIVTTLAFSPLPATSPPVQMADRPPILGMPLTILPDPVQKPPPVVKPVPGALPRGRATRAVRVARGMAAHPVYAVPVAYVGRHRAPATAGASRAAAPSALPAPVRQPVPAPKPAPKPLPAPKPKPVPPVEAPPPEAVAPPVQDPPPDEVVPPEQDPPPDQGGGCGD